MNDRDLTPPAPVREPYRAHSPDLARMTNIRPLAKPDPFLGCENSSDRLARMLEIADERDPIHGNALFLRP